MPFGCSGDHRVSPSEKAEEIYNRYVEGVYALRDREDFDALVGADKPVKNKDEYELLATTFGRGKDGIFTKDETRQLEEYYGKNDAFVAELKKKFGVNELKALQARAAWLADNAKPRRYWFNYSENARVAMKAERKILLAVNPNANDNNASDQTGLMVAAEAGDAKLTAVLISKGVDVNSQNKNGWTALMMASGRRNPEVVRLLIENGADVNAVNPLYLRTALLEATQNGRTEAVRMLLGKGARPNFKDQDGKTALMIAVQGGYVEIVRLLIEKGADVHSKNKDGQTPLMLAAQIGHPEIARMLIEKGADVRAKDSSGRTALMLASWNGHAEMIRTLLERGADINAMDNGGETALMWASEKCNEELVKLLIDSGVNVNAKTDSGWTSLMQASRGGCDQTVELLIAGGANIHAKNENQETAMMLASKLAGDETLRVLKYAEGDLVEKDKSVHVEDLEGKESVLGGSKLIWASYYGHEDLVRKLIATPEQKKEESVCLTTEVYQKVDSRNYRCRTALMVAAMQGHTRIAEMLIAAGANVNAYDRGEEIQCVEKKKNKKGISVWSTSLEPAVVINAGDSKKKREKRVVAKNVEKTKADEIVEQIVRETRGQFANCLVSRYNWKREVCMYKPGMTVLQWAVAGGHVEMVELLKTNGAQ